MLRTLVAMVVALVAIPASGQAAEAEQYDVVIYGGTSGGVAAAVQAARMDRSVVLIEPTKRLGGLSSGGLGQTDIGNKQAIGGISREFYQRIRTYYENPQAWKWQKPEEYRSRGQSFTQSGEDTLWTFEPSAALHVFNEMVREHKVPVVYGERLDLRPGVGVKKEGTRITAIVMESGRTFRGRTFIDATYEGDLLAKAGVSYTVGREANAQYDETLSGVQTGHARYHQLQKGVSPYIDPSDPQSGLLPGIDPDGPGEEFSGDHRVQAYNFRMCLTNHPENRIPFKKPEGYNELDFELLFRNFEAGEKQVPWINSPMPNRKTDINNRLGFSTDFIGQNYDYPEGDYATREKIVERHRHYHQGLMWTLANHPRVPEPIRKTVSQWGMCKDEFVEGEGWQEQLYIREARRMVSDYVMTQHNCQGREVAEDSVGLAAYTMDSHHTQRYITPEGYVQNEGDVQVGGFPPYPISYRSIVPKRDECTNLFVPVCLSASHMAFGSIRMEPVFMVLGQSAATAAVLAIEENVAAQDVDYTKLRARLVEDKQRLDVVHKHDVSKLPGVVVDDGQAERQGPWMASRSVGEYVGNGYLHDSDQNKGECVIRFRAVAKKAGKYEVRVSYSANANRSASVPVVVETPSKTLEVKIDQRKTPPQESLWFPVATTELEAGQAVTVTISNAGTKGHVIADAVQLLPVK